MRCSRDSNPKVGKASADCHECESPSLRGTSWNAAGALYTSAVLHPKVGECLVALGSALRSLSPMSCGTFIVVELSEPIREIPTCSGGGASMEDDKATALKPSQREG